MRRKLGAGIAATAALLAFGGYALADGEPAGIDAGANACADRHPCVIVNQLATGADTPKLATAEGILAAEGRPVGDCPEAEAVYDRSGVAVDAVLGPCPSASDASEDVISFTDRASQVNYALAVGALKESR
jgi:hypothetical protein